MDGSAKWPRSAPRTVWSCRLTSFGSLRFGPAVCGFNGARWRKAALLTLASLAVPAVVNAADTKTGDTRSAGASLNVKAHYQINYAGVDIGDFYFRSEVKGGAYNASGDANVKLMYGAFEWDVKLKSSGVLADGPRPEAFKLVFTKKKKKKVTMVRFKGHDVSGVVHQPPFRYSSKYVPVTPAHLRNVMDPLSALMNLSQGPQKDPCQQTLEVFDGKMRLRLALSPKGRRRISEVDRSGQPLFGYVCKVDYTPIAGHKRGRQVSAVAASSGIEIVLRPVPDAGLFVPYQIYVPTSVGTVSIVARSISIFDGGGRKIAMRH